MNYKNDSTFANDLWKCSKCLNQDTEAHLLWCPGYQDMRQGLDLADNHDLCSYLQKIFTLRCNEEKGWKLKSSHDLWLFSCTELVHFSTMWSVGWARHSLCHLFWTWGNEATNGLECCHTIGLDSYQMWTYVSDYPLDSFIDPYDCCICAWNHNNNKNFPNQPDILPNHNP